MAFCSNCGAQMNEGVKFCGKCGNPAVQTPPQPQQAYGNTAAPQGAYQNAAGGQVFPPPQTPPKQGGVKKPVIIAAISAFVVLAIVIGVVLFISFTKMKQARDAAYAFIDQGVGLREEGKLDDAIQAFNAALADYNVIAEDESIGVVACVERGRTYYEKGDYDRAIDDYTADIRYDPNNHFPYYERGDAYYAKGDYDKAIAEYTEALRINPNYTFAYNNRGGAYANKGDYDRAIADWEAVLRIEPDHPSAPVNIERVRQQRGY